MIALDGGEFLMGSTDRFAYPEDGEGPLRRVRLDGFEIEPCAVTNADVVRFVDETDHVTDAERYGCCFVFAGFLPRRLPSDPRRGGRALVAPGRGG